MDRSLVYLLGFVFFLVSSTTAAAPVTLAFGEDDPAKLEFVELQKSEMELVEGELGPLGWFALEMFSAALAGATKEAIDQYSETGEIKPGKLILAGGYTAAFVAANTGAVLSQSVLLMVVTLGLDLALYASYKFAQDPGVVDRPPEEFSQGYLDNFDAERFALTQANYESGRHLEFNVDASYIGVLALAGAVDPTGGFIGAGQFYVGVGAGFGVSAAIGGGYGSGDSGAGEAHYRYF